MSWKWSCKARSLHLSPLFSPQLSVSFPKPLLFFFLLLPEHVSGRYYWREACYRPYELTTRVVVFLDRLERANPNSPVRYLPHSRPKDNCLARVKRVGCWSNWLRKFGWNLCSCKKFRWFLVQLLFVFVKFLMIVNGIKIHVGIWFELS